MRDIHLNLFQSYSQGKPADLVRGKPLENNVTRALIITLMKSQPIVAESFLRTLLGIDSKDPLEYDLQDLKNPHIRDVLEKKGTKRILLGIAPSTATDENHFPEVIERAIDRMRKEKPTKREESGNALKDLQAELARHRKHIEEGTFQRRHLEETLAKLPGVKMSDARQLSKDPDELSDQIDYLFDLTLGSRADAWISVGDHTVILLENKIHGGLVRAQMLRHRAEGFRGYEDQVHWITKTWKEVYGLFDDLRSKLEGDNLLLDNFTDYLEDNGMGHIRFTDEHIDAFSSANDPDSRDLLRVAHEMIREASELCTKAMPDENLVVKRRQFDSEYLGAEIVGSPQEDFSRVIHLSVGMSGKRMGVYAIAEPKGLIEKMVANWKGDKSKFQNEFAQILGALPYIHKWIEPVVVVTKKWFFIPGLRSYQEDMILPVSKAVHSISDIMERLDHLLVDEHLQEQLRAFYPDKDYKSRAIYGTILIEYRFMAEFVVGRGKGITEDIKKAFAALVPVYNFLKSKT